MTRIKGSITKRKSRVNVESDLQFNGINQAVVAPADTRYNFGAGNWAMSIFFDSQETMVGALNHNAFFALDKEDVGAATTRIICGINEPNEIRIVLDATNITGERLFDFLYPQILTRDLKSHLVLQRVGQEISVYINSVKLQISGVTPPPVGAGETFNLSGGDIIIGASMVDGSAAVNCKLSHASYFNASLNQQEINYLYENAGIIPDTKHLNCIAYYPLTERQPFKADADFIAKHAHLAVGDNVFFDVVNEVNVTKPERKIDLGSLNDGDGGFVGGFVLDLFSIIIILNSGDASKEMTRDLSSILATDIFLFSNRDISGFNVQVQFINNEDDAVIETFTITSGNLSTHTFSRINYPQNISVKIIMSKNNPADTSTYPWDLLEITEKLGLKPNHAKTVNFTDTQLGLIQPASQTVRKDFYSKQRSTFYGMNFKESLSQNARSTITTSFNLGFTDFTIYFDYVHKQRVTSNNWLFEFMNVSKNNGMLGEAPFDRFNFIFYDNGTFKSFSPQNTLVVGERYKVVYLRKGNNLNNDELYINGKRELPMFTDGAMSLSLQFIINGNIDIGSISVGSLRTPGANADQYGTGQMNDLVFKDTLLSSEQARVASIEGYIPFPTEQCFIEKTSGGFLSMLGNTFVISNRLANTDLFFPEKLSGLPESKQGLHLDGHLGNRRLLIESSITSQDSREFTAIFSFKYNSLNTSGVCFFALNDGGELNSHNYISVLRNTSGNLALIANRANTNFDYNISINLDSVLLEYNVLVFRLKDGYADIILNGTVVESVTNPLLQCPNIAAFNQGAINGSTQTTLATDTTQVFNYISDSFLTLKEVKKISNNTLTAYLDEALFKKAIVILNYNRGVFGAGANDIFIHEYVSNTSVFAKVQNFEGITPTEQFASVLENLTDIAQLR